MDTFNLIAGGALLFILCIFVFRLTYVISRNLIAGKKFHKDLEKELEHLRLGRMLTALGINKRVYIHKTSAIDVKEQMSNCNQCVNTSECDTKLDREDIDINAIDFCNNETALKGIKQSAVERS